MVPPPAPPPPEEPTPGVQPHYTVPSETADRWLGRGAPYYGIAAGMLFYIAGYIYSAIATATEPDKSYAQLTAMTTSITGGVIATVVLLIPAIVLMGNPRTRAFGSGLAISMATGVLCGAGVCTALAFTVGRG